jgi:hypothetical protein
MKKIILAVCMICAITTAFSQSSLAGDPSVGQGKGIPISTTQPGLTSTSQLPNPGIPTPQPIPISSSTTQLPQCDYFFLEQVALTLEKAGVPTTWIYIYLGDLEAELPQQKCVGTIK